ncbi:MAG: hypothetical protein KGI75_01655 [Rhizobiaceae bacterium]|nr:hypothetical protein [Rhizobiaceae bacterium]
MKARAVVATTLLFAVVAGASARAADLPQPFIVPEAKPAEDSGWTFAVSPYFWGAGVSGDVGQFGLPATHLQSDFGDILKDLDFGFMAVGEARYDRFSVFGDVIYTKVSSGRATPLGIVASSVDVTSKTFAGLAGAGYAVLQDRRSNLDIVAGARVWNARTEISFSGGLLDSAAGSDSATWVDAMGGFRGRYFLTDSIYLSAWGLVGAGQAKLDWDVAAGAGYEFNHEISAIAGYRALGVDYSKNDFVFDVVQQGPILGLVVHF